MEKKYWELRKNCEQAFEEFMETPTDSKLATYREALGLYQDCCMDILERLMDENADVLKNLKN